MWDVLITSLTSERILSCFTVWSSESVVLLLRRGFRENPAEPAVAVGLKFHHTSQCDSHFKNAYLEMSSDLKQAIQVRCPQLFVIWNSVVHWKMSKIEIYMHIICSLKVRGSVWDQRWSTCEKRSDEDISCVTKNLIVPRSYQRRMKRSRRRNLNLAPNLTSLLLGQTIPDRF